ncbi:MULTISPECIES: hypothetical protein [unclassified Streptomyces]|uniref:hypothetical protein n=1 Tax=unclassified Streptomyces TaxID=2593676 RepID=UPI0015E187BE|nr:MULTISPECIES: hypothetical protein [unclassified Streptomyces]
MSRATRRSSRSSQELVAFSRRSTQRVVGSRTSTELFDLRSFLLSSSSAVASPTVTYRPWPGPGTSRRKPCGARIRTAGACGPHTSTRTRRRSTATVTGPAGPGTDLRAIHSGTPSAPARAASAATCSGPPHPRTANSPSARANSAARRAFTGVAVPVTRVTGTVPAASASRSSGRSVPPPPSQHPRRYASAMAARFSSPSGVTRPPLRSSSSVSSTDCASGFHDRSP